MTAAPDTTDELVPTDRTTLRRKKERGRFDRALVHAILDEALLAHVGFTTDAGPVVLPMTYARIGDQLYLHGATGNAMLRTLAAGTDVCVTVTLLDGIVFARSAFHHSMNYRSVVVFGRAERVTDPEEELAATTALLDHMAPGRSADARLPTPEELRSTLFVRLPIEEASAKVRTGGPIDDEEDMELPVWAGVLPLPIVPGRPVDEADTQAAAPPYATEHRLRPRPPTAG